MWGAIDIRHGDDDLCLFGFVLLLVLCGLCMVSEMAQGISRNDMVVLIEYKSIVSLVFAS